MSTRRAQTLNPGGQTDTGEDVRLTPSVRFALLGAGVGRPDQAGKAQPGGGTDRRSETVTVALVAGAVLLWILAAVGRLPTKLSFAGGGVEFNPLTRRELETLGSKVGEKATRQGISDPGQVGGAIARAYNVAVVDKSRGVKAPDTCRGMGR